MVISQPPGNNPSYYYRTSPTLYLNCSRWQRHLIFYTCNYNIRVTHRNELLLSIFFTRIRSTEGSSAWIVLYSFVARTLALHLAVKILLQIFLYEDLSTLTLHTSVGCISLQNASRTALCCYATNTIKWKHSLIFDINHQQNTRRSDQIETIKHWASAAPSYHAEGLPMAQVHF